MLEEKLDLILQKLAETESSEEGILKYNLSDPYAKEAFNRAVNSTSAYLALSAIQEEIFRPYRKHGYEDNRIPSVEEMGDETYNTIAVLEEKFFQILEEYNINFDDLS